MTLITKNRELQKICTELNKVEYITVDTEFLREKFYYPKLCLIQVADENNAYAVDPLSRNLSLEPLFEVLSNKKVTKVFHSARQDIEIIYNLSQKMPTPLFDTQIAAMVCGFGESASYASLVEQISGHELDKSSRFTDWSHRPLSERQLKYSLSDVTYLRDIYKKLKVMLIENNRMDWVKEEMHNLLNPQNYTIDPEEVWKKIRARGNSRRFFGAVKELAKWRELMAMQLNKPRNQILRDPILLEIAANLPTNMDDLKIIRGAGKVIASYAEEIIGLMKEVSDLPDNKLPPLKKSSVSKLYDKALFDLLKVLLKMKSQEHKVAEKLVASSDDLIEIITSNNPETYAVKGWRYEIFGKYAIELKKGKLALSANNGKMLLIEID